MSVYTLSSTPASDSFAVESEYEPMPGLYNQFDSIFRLSLPLPEETQDKIDAEIQSLNCMVEQIQAGIDEVKNDTINILSKINKFDNRVRSWSADDIDINDIFRTEPNGIADDTTTPSEDIAEEITEYEFEKMMAELTALKSSMISEKLSMDFAWKESNAQDKNIEMQNEPLDSLSAVPAETIEKEP